MQKFKDVREIHNHIVGVRRHDPRAPSRAVIYTDGAANPNPGAGGWAFVMNVPGVDTIEHYGGAADTTNNRMEMMALLMAMRALPQGITGVIYSDSKLLINGVTSWMHTWAKNGWRRPANRYGDGGEVKNVDIWQQIHEARFRRSFDFRWVKGHDGNQWNERADELAEMGRVACMEGQIAPIEIPPAVMPSASAPPPRLAV